MLKTTEERARGLGADISTTSGGRSGGRNVPAITAKGSEARDESVLAIIRENPSVTQREISEILSIGISTVTRATDSLKKKGVLTRAGSTKKGIWVIQESKK